MGEIKNHSTWKTHPKTKKWNTEANWIPYIDQTFKLGQIPDSRKEKTTSNLIQSIF